MCFACQDLKEINSKFDWSKNDEFVWQKRRMNIYRKRIRNKARRFRIERQTNLLVKRENKICRIRINNWLIMRNIFSWQVVFGLDKSPNSGFAISGYCATLNHRSILLHSFSLKHCVKLFRSSQSRGTLAVIRFAILAGIGTC